MEYLSPRGVDFHIYVKDCRLYHYDGIELTSEQVTLVWRTVKRAMREADRPKRLRKPLSVGLYQGRSFAITADAMHDHEGQLIAVGPLLSDIANAMGRRERQRWQADASH